MSANLILFILLSLIAIVSAIGMLVSRNAVYSALWLIVNFGAVAVFYLILSAPFIALAQVTVYGGAIMVLFLFVIMLLGASQVGQAAARWWWLPAAICLAVVLLLESGYFVMTLRQTAPAATPEAAFGSPVAVGLLLFSNYLLPFEVISVLLLAALVGAVVLTKKKM